MADQNDRPQPPTKAQLIAAMEEGVNRLSELGASALLVVFGPTTREHPTDVNAVRTLITNDTIPEALMHAEFARHAMMARVIQGGTNAREFVQAEGMPPLFLDVEKG